MKLSKKLLLLPLLLLLAITAYSNLTKSHENHLSPVSENNDYRQLLEKALFLANLKPQMVTPREYINEIEFYIDNKQIIVSTKKDPFWQVSSLQDILKIAKINNQVIKFIDLSSAHPYATTL